MRLYVANEAEEALGRHWRKRVSTAARRRVDKGNIARYSLKPSEFESWLKGVGAGVYEYRIDFGPGYRIYFGKDGDRLVILLAGGTKKRQDADIAAAKGHWRDYKRRKRQEVT